MTSVVNVPLGQTSTVCPACGAEVALHPNTAMKPCNTCSATIAIRWVPGLDPDGVTRGSVPDCGLSGGAAPKANVLYAVSAALAVTQENPELQVTGSIRLAPGHSIISDAELAALRADRERSEFMGSFLWSDARILRMLLDGTYEQYLRSQGVEVPSNPTWRQIIDIARGASRVSPAQAAGKDGQK